MCMSTLQTLQVLQHSFEYRKLILVLAEVAVAAVAIIGLGYGRRTAVYRKQVLHSTVLYTNPISGCTIPCPTKPNLNHTSQCTLSFPYPLFFLPPFHPTLLLPLLQCPLRSSNSSPSGPQAMLPKLNYSNTSFFNCTVLLTLTPSHPTVSPSTLCLIFLRYSLRGEGAVEMDKMEKIEKEEERKGRVLV